MRKIQNNSLIRFFYGDLENIIKEPFPDDIKARPGDMFRILVNKYEIGSTDYNSLRLCLMPAEFPSVTPIKDRIPVVENIGTIRKQMSESFTHFRLKLNSFVKDKYTQFILSTETGLPLFAPYSYSGDSATKMIQGFANHIEKSPSYIVRTKINGPIIDVYMIHNEHFRLASNIKTELGSVSSVNQNTPSLSVVLLSTFLRGSNKDYAISISGTIVKGNSFTFNNQTYVAKAGDTSQNVIDFFTDTNVINIPDSEAFSLLFDPGQVVRPNSRIPSIFASKTGTTGGIDSYKIGLAGQYEVGNVLTVFTSGRTISHVVESGDTISSMEAIFNPDAGFFKVPENTQVSTKAIPGQQIVNNNNVVEFFLSILKVYPAQNVQRYGVSVGTDVVKGNEFSIVDESNDVDLKVIATSSDSVFSISEKLSGQQNPYFVYDRVVNSGSIQFISNKGYAYTFEDMTDIVVTSQPTIPRPDQVVAEIIFPEYDELERGRYILAVRSSIDGGIVSIASQIDFNDNEQSSLIESSDVGNVFGFHYSEGGITQRFRMPLVIKQEISSITESMGTNIDGVEESINVKIGYMAPFSSRAMQLNSAKSTVIALKSDFVRVNDRLVRFSDIEQISLSEYNKSCILKGSCEYIDEYVDNYNRTIYPRVFAGSNAVIRTENTFGLRLFLCNANFTKEISTESAIPADGYFIETIAGTPGKGFIRILVRDQENVLVEMEVDKELKHRSIPFRIHPGSRVSIELIEINQINNEGFYPIESIDVPVIYEPESSPKKGKGFSYGFSDGFY